MAVDEQTRACCERIEQGYAELLGDDLIAFAAMGSSVTGATTAGWSDLDVAVFVRPQAYDDGALSLALAADAQRLVESIDVASAGYAFFSPMFMNPERRPSNWPGLFPGTYETLRGVLPRDAEATPEACCAVAKRYLSRARQVYEDQTLRFAGLHDYGVSGKDIVAWIRSIRHDVKYLMLSAIAFSCDDYTGVWAMGKNRAIELFRSACFADDDLGRFYTILAQHPPSLESVPALKEASLRALRFIRSCAQFADDRDLGVA
jgi:hypothetical protein